VVRSSGFISGKFGESFRSIATRYSKSGTSRFCANFSSEIAEAIAQARYYWQLLTHYYLTHESEYFHVRDQQEWHQQLSWGEGKVFLPDLETYTLKVEAMRALGIFAITILSRRAHSKGAIAADLTCADSGLRLSLQAATNTTVTVDG
jgi:hypothetical protein